MITRTAILAAATLATTLSAQVDRDWAYPVASHKLYNATSAEILGYAIQGFRPSNIEIGSINPTRFHGSVIENEGVYARTWTIYFDKTKQELAQLLIQNNQRPVDIERYTVGLQTYYAAIAFHNSGAAQKTWNWFTNVAQGSVLTTVQNVGGRIIDLETHSENGNRVYDIISIANSGADYRAWWVYTNTTTAAVQNHMAVHGSRLYDFEEQGLFDNDAAVLVRDSVPSRTFFSPNNFLPSWDGDVEFGGRIIGVANYNISDEIVTIVDSTDPFEEFGNPSDGTQGPTVHTGWGRALTGTQIDYTVTNLRPWAPAALHVGFFQTSIALDILGATGCVLYTLPEVVVGVYAAPNGIATVEVDVPNQPSLHGATLVTQMLAVDPGANALNIQASNGIATTVRHW